jgi:glycine/D-amino acid oxidase-like deaminating enzyme
VDHGGGLMSAARTKDCDALVIGGGVFGAWLALDLARRGQSVVLLEREAGLLQRASLNNQARIHNGYHYPRSILTGLRSRVDSARFRAEFSDCVDATFTMLYAVARRGSNVTPAQFKSFCSRIGAPLAPARKEHARWFDAGLVAEVWEAEEWAFDAVRLAQRLSRALTEQRIDVRTACEAVRIERALDGAVRLCVEARLVPGGEPLVFGAAHVFNCTYAGLNDLLRASGLPRVPLKVEMAELALVEVPPELQRIGVTVMCGPFFSFMPFPPRGAHTLSHVRYTPHHAWQDGTSDIDSATLFDGAPRRSHFPSMQMDARRYMPIVGRFVQTGSLFELKALLPQSEADDSRPILFKRDAGVPGLTCVLGGKIDNVYDMERELDALLQGSEAPR